jgi:hypothetical protein
MASSRSVSIDFSVSVQSTLMALCNFGDILETKRRLFIYFDICAVDFNEKRGSLKKTAQVKDGKSMKLAWFYKTTL